MDLEIEIDLDDVITDDGTSSCRDDNSKLAKKKGWSLPFVAPRPNPKKICDPVDQDLNKSSKSQHKLSSKDCCPTDPSPPCHEPELEPQEKPPGQHPHEFLRRFRCPSRLGPSSGANLQSCQNVGRLERAVSPASGSHPISLRHQQQETVAEPELERPSSNPQIQAKGTGENELSAAHKASWTPLVQTESRGAIANKGGSSRKRITKQMKPPLKKAFVEDGIESDQLDPDHSCPSDCLSGEISAAEDGGQNRRPVASNPFVSERSRSKNEQFKQELKERAKRQVSKPAERAELGPLLQSFQRQRQGQGDADSPIDLTEDNSSDAGTRGVHLWQDSDDEDLSCLDEKPGPSAPTGRGTDAVQNGPGCCAEPGWWRKLPDFVPVSELARGLNPRTGSVVYINYKAQFQEESPDAAPKRKKATAPRAKKAKPADAASKAKRAYFARRGGFKRRR